MSQEKYIGMDLHQATVSVAVVDRGRDEVHAERPSRGGCTSVHRIHIYPVPR